MNEEDKKLFDKFDAVLKSKPSDEQTKNFFAGLEKNELDRLIYLFENNEIRDMPDIVRNRLIEIFKKLKELKK